MVVVCYKNPTAESSNLSPGTYSSYGIGLLRLAGSREWANPEATEALTDDAPSELGGGATLVAQNTPEQITPYQTHLQTTTHKQKRKTKAHIKIATLNMNGRHTRSGQSENNVAAANTKTNTPG